MGKGEDEMGKKVVEKGIGGKLGVKEDVEREKGGRGSIFQENRDKAWATLMVSVPLCLSIHLAITLFIKFSPHSFFLSLLLPPFVCPCMFCV